MAATSKHYLDVNKWIEQVINSCTNQIQICYADKLIDNFEKYLVDYVNPKFASMLIRNLRVHSYVKLETITSEWK